MGCMGLFVMQPRLLILCLRKIGETEPRGGGLGLLSPSRARTEAIPLNRAPRNCAVCHRSERSGSPGAARRKFVIWCKRADVLKPYCSQLFTQPRLWRLEERNSLSAVPPPQNIPRGRVVSGHARGGAAHASPLTWCRRRGGASSLPPACQGVPSRRVRRQR